MTTTSSRLLELLSLLQARRDWPGAELADRLAVSGRTIRRDVDRLRELGYPVESLTGPAGGYRLRAGTAMPPLLLDDEEAIAIAVGLLTAARSSVAGIKSTACFKMGSWAARISSSGSSLLAPLNSILGVNLALADYQGLAVETVTLAVVRCTR